MTQSLSVVIITQNEEANIARTLQSVSLLLKEAPGEIIVVDSGSTDRTVEIAQSHGAKVFTEPWKGYAAQKNSAIAKASGDWILSLDADEEVSAGLSTEIPRILQLARRWRATGMPTDNSSEEIASRDLGLEYGLDEDPVGFKIPRRNLFLNRWMKRGGFWPDHKLRLFQRGAATFAERTVHEVAKVDGNSVPLRHPLIHHAYPTLAGYIGHMNKYSSLGADQAAKEGKRGFSFINIALRPAATFIYNYIFRFGFLDGREGLLLHLYHAAYTSWKYAKLWELTRGPRRPSN
jgi:glycosyltransferase involved in cell wall biosynthesis